MIVYCVNDGAVMGAWGKDQKVGLSMIQLMGDPHAELTKALSMELTHPGPTSVGIVGRCKRHAIYAEKGIIKAVRVAESEEDPAGDAAPEVTLVDGMLDAIRESRE